MVRKDCLKRSTDRDMKCTSELISCLGKSIPNKKKKGIKQKSTAKVKPLSGYHGTAGWPVQLEQREGVRGREAEGSWRWGQRVVYQPPTTVRVLGFIPVWEIMGAIGERTDMV